MCAVLCGICNKYKPVRVGSFWILGLNHVNGSVKELCLRGFFGRILTMHRNNPLRWSKSLSDLHNKNVNFWQNVLDSQVRKPVADLRIGNPMFIRFKSLINLD